MPSLLRKKVNRYTGLFKEVENWPKFLLFKINPTDNNFTFKLRSSYSITVPKKLFSPFKEIFFDQVYLRNIREKLQLGERPTIIDIGANVGYFSLYMLFNFPNARVYSFEPMPYNFKRLMEYKNQYGFTNLHAVNKAVTDGNSGITINYSSNDDFTTVASINGNSSKAKKLEVESVNLETILERYKIDTVDFLKIDCEGAEYMILYATPNHVLKRIKAMAIETHPSKKENENTEALSAFLSKNGFSLKMIGELKSETGYIWAWQ